MQARIESLGSGEIDKTWWHCVRLTWPRPRGGIRQITIASLHIEPAQAKKPVAGPRALEAALDAAINVCPEVDFVTGDVNGARQAGLCYSTVRGRPRGSNSIAWPPLRLPPAPPPARRERHGHGCARAEGLLCGLLGHGMLHLGPP